MRPHQQIIWPLNTAKHPNIFYDLVDDVFNVTRLTKDTTSLRFNKQAFRRARLRMELPNTVIYVR